MPSHGTTTLSPQHAAQLRAVDFTYSEVGATRGELPDGFHHLRNEVVVGHGESRFRQVSRAVMTWQVQLRAGVAVAAADETVAADSVARLAVGVGPLRLHAPVRVVYVIDEPRRAGFAYGTLPGHPELGEELFAVEHRDDDSVVFVVAAFSRPGSLITRLAGPIGPVAQRLAAGRYLKGMRSLPAT